MTMTKTDIIMDKVCDYLYETTLQMLVQVEAEAYEMAEETRSDIEMKLTSIKRLLIQKNLTTLTEEELQETLTNTKNKFIRDWYGVLEIPGERQIYNI